MKLLRPLAGYTLYDHKTNDYIRRELRITDTLDKIDEYRRNWLSHLQRKPQNRIPLKSYRYRPQGRRTIGRPKKRWREQLFLWRRNGSKGPILDVYDDDHYRYMNISRSIPRRMRNNLDRVCRENRNMSQCSVSFFQKCYRLWDNVEKCGKAGQATDDNTI